MPTMYLHCGFLILAKTYSEKKYKLIEINFGEFVLKKLKIMTICTCCLERLVSKQYYLNKFSVVILAFLTISR